MTSATGNNKKMTNVVLIGATGATGKQLTAQLLLCKEITKVTALGRRKVDLSEFATLDQVEEEKAGRLVQNIVDFDTLAAENASQYFDGQGVFVSCLGTTRRSAGSAEAFTKIDTGYPLKCADIAKQCGVPHVVLLSSQGAKSNSWMPYLKSKGLLEKSFIDYKFPFLSILRPGMLDRGASQRFGEKIAGVFLGKIPVQVVAKAICHTILEQSGEAAGDAKHRIFEDSAIRQVAVEYDNANAGQETTQ